MKIRELSDKEAIAAGQNIKERDYWLNKLSGEWIKSRFPYDYEPGEDIGNREREKYQEIITFNFPTDISSRVIKLSNKSDNRLFIILFTGLVVLLYKYTGNKDIILGAPIYKQKITGDFINTVLALRNRFDVSLSFKELLLDVRQTLFEAVENQNYPIEALVYKLNIPVEEDGFPLFDVAILLENVQEKNYIKHVNVNLLMSFLRKDTDSLVAGKWHYNSTCYKKTTIERIFSHLTILFRHALGDVNIKIADIEIISEAEKKQLLVEFNDTSGEYPRDQTLHQWFEIQVEKSLDSPALVFGEQELSYTNLNKQSNRLAHRLREKGVKPDSIVALMAERSLEMIFGLLGVLKAGGALLPIDPTYPEGRKEYMLTDSGVRLVLTNFDRDMLDYIPREVEIIDLRAEGIYSGEETNPKPVNTAEDLFYLIYTSGSTGKPKGVMLEHKNMVNLIYFDLHHTNIDCSKILQFHTIGFDASFHEIFCALLSGGVLVLINEVTRGDIEELLHIVEKSEIKTLFLPMSFLKLIFNAEEYINIFPPCVRHIQTAGEQVVVSPRFRRFLQENQVYLHNHYGPSETHVVTALTLDPCGEIPELPAIGKPILNTEVYILDQEKKLLPIGVPGELFIGGVQVGRGYWRRDEFTREKFIPDPFKEGQRLYGTGDLARWREDGNIEFLGRLDNQVKIRGFRIEPGEIEARLMSHEKVKEAVVIASENEQGEKYLCAYIVAGSKAQSPESPGTNPGFARDEEYSELRDYLSETLPDYMIPSYIVPLEKIPLTPSGKVDRRSLPAVETTGTETLYAPPRSETEKRFCQLWSEVLGVEEDKIGLDHNFFKLGGHSLKATVLIARIHKVFNVKVTLEEIFNRPTIRGLAECIKELAEDRYLSIKPVEKKEYYPLSSAQKRLYIQQQVIPDNISYNMPMYITLEGELDSEKLAEVFRQLIRRHENLRTSFEMPEEEPMQRIHDPRDIEFEIEYHNAEQEDLNTESGEACCASIIENFIRPFDLSTAPLFRVGLIKLPGCSETSTANKCADVHILMVDIHHIISDGISLGIMSKEFMQLYRGKRLADLAIQYKDFSQWQNRFLESEEITGQETFWLKQFEGDIPVLNLPTDYPRSEVRSFAGEYVDFPVDRKLTAAVNRLILETETTLHVVLLAVYNVLLAKYSGQEDIVVGTGIAGRQHADLENIIGIFINMLAMRNRLKDNMTFIRFLEDVKRNALDAYANQDYQFEELVRKLNLQGNPARNPIFDVVFQTQNIDIPEIEIQGLTFKPYQKDFQVSHFDLVIYSEEQDGHINLRLLYSPALFKRSTIHEMARHFVEILTQVSENWEVKLKDIMISTHIVEARPKISKQEVRFRF